MKTISTYEQAALDWKAKYGVTFNVEYVGHFKHFEDDGNTRDVYSVTIQRGERKHTFQFGQSLVDSAFGHESKGSYWDKVRRDRKFGKHSYRVTPTVYDVMSAVQKSDPGTHSDFCGDFGYDTDSRKALDLYLRVQTEYRELLRVLGDEAMEAAQEIQ